MKKLCALFMLVVMFFISTGIQASTPDLKKSSIENVVKMSSLFVKKLDIAKSNLQTVLKERPPVIQTKAIKNFSKNYYSRKAPTIKKWHRSYA